MIYLLLTLIGTLATPLHAFAAAATPTFVSLSDIPAFNDIINASGAVDLSKVLNSIYGLCIGLAAVLAVIQLMYAGILYMGGDSITEKKVARQKITAAFLGLLLVLSPAIVFGIIDKRILSLSIDTSPLAPSTTTTTTTTTFTQSGFPSGGTWDSTATGAADACTQQGGTPTTNGGTVHCTGKAANCPVLTGTSVQIASDGSQDACCTGNYKLTKQTRGQNSCTLSQ